VPLQVDPRKEGQQPIQVSYRILDVGFQMTYVFTRDLPSWLFLVELLSDTVWDTDDNVRLDCSERSDSGSSWLGSKGSDGGSKGSVEGSVTIVSEFSCLSAIV
jgi:hypothetical protein